LRGEIKEWLTQDCKTRHDPDTALKTALDLLQQGEAAAQRRGTTMIGVGVGVSSPVYKIGHARSIHPAIHPQWQGVKLSDILEEHLSIPVFMENDANLGALAELWWQKEHKTQNLVYLKIATGLGAGIVVNGKIMPGAHGLAGEFGHTLTKTINNQDVLPHILNTKIGFEFLLQGLELQLSADDPARLTRGDLLRRAFSSAQPRGRQILNYLVDQLTPAIVNLLVLVDPELVVLGGEFPYLGHHILDRLKQMVNHHVIWPELQNIPLMLSGFGEQQTAIGGATLVLDHALADISLFREAKGRPVEVRSYASKLP
jgi:predicted NBD/HSP70 family sugar kinase